MQRIGNRQSPITVALGGIGSLLPVGTLGESTLAASCQCHPGDIAIVLRGAPMALRASAQAGMMNQQGAEFNRGPST
jgi:hypothetical protein